MTTIGRLRLQWGVDEPTCPSLLPLQMLDLEPPAMPPQAILCIRALRDPMPGVIDLRPHASRALEWEAAMRRALADAFATAARPARGFVPAAASAVFFADRAELLACAARHGMQGWWWGHLIVDSERSIANVVREWLRHPTYVPAAVELLDENDELVPFVRAIPRAEALRLIEAMLRAHALPELAAEVVQALVSTSEAPIARAPWHAVLEERAEAVRHFTIEQRVFAALAIVVRRAPLLARRATFARDVVAFITHERSAGVPPARAGRLARRYFAVTNTNPAARDAPRVRARRRARPPHSIIPTIPTVEEAPARSSPPAPTPAKTMAVPPPPPSAPSSAPPDVGRASARPDELKPVLHLPATPRPEAAITVHHHLPTAPDLVLVTSCAGLFFLLTPMLDLRFYSDFTSPVQRGLEIDLWSFLRYAARTFVGLEFADDPLDALLAEFAEEDLQEAPVDEVEQIRAWLFDREIDDPALVVGRPGRLTATPAHLDLWFSLARHPIELRIAALDRDPGFVPAAGRHVAFHFD